MSEQLQQQQARARPAKPKASDKGEWKLGVYFVNHNQAQARAYYFYSNKAQDKAGTSAGRLKKMVLSKNWEGKVNWAGLYHNGALMATFKREDGVWQQQ